MANNTSQHILSTSANLIGFCLIIITSIRIADLTETLIIDNLTSIVALLLTFSCVFAFISLRTKIPSREKLFENLADYAFMTSLIGILVIIMLISFNFIK